MAKMLRNIGEYVSGKIGNVVFVRTKTKSYVRAAPVRKKNNWSEPQLLYRQRMSKVCKLWRSLKSGQMGQIWNRAAIEMNGFAWFVKLNIQAFAIDGTLIDPTMIKVSDGQLAGPQRITAERVAADPAAIGVNWQNDPHLKAERLNDGLMAMSYTDGIFSPITPTGLKRGDKTGTFPLPQPVPFAEPTHLFLFMASGDGSECTTSLSFGI